MDIEFRFQIYGVPNEDTADDVAESLMNALRENHNTDMIITWEVIG